GEHGTLYQGAPLVSEQYVSMYRFHEPDPVYFQSKIKVTLQQMGTGRKANLTGIYGDKLIFQPKNHPRRAPDDGFYLRSDDYSVTAYWYQYPLVQNRKPLPERAQ